MYGRLTRLAADAGGSKKRGNSSSGRLRRTLLYGALARREYMGCSLAAVA